MTMLLVALGAAAAAALAVLTCAGLLISVSLLVLKPWEPAFTRDYASMQAQQPYPVFWLMCTLGRWASLFQQLKPAPVRIVELAHAYISSHVLFALCALDVAGLLRDGQPKTAQQLAAAVGPRVDGDQLGRLLKMASVLGLVERKRGLAGSVDVYSANAVTAVLCRDHPNSMADYALLNRDHVGPFSFLSEGIKSGTTPFKLWPDAHGPTFWSHIAASPAHEATFDGAMRACNHTGALMAVEQYAWDRYDCVVDIGGGNGQFLAALLTRYPGLQGVLLDQAAQVERGRQWFAKDYPQLQERMQFEVGDFFESATLPRPRAGAKTVYVLKQVLHDWSDADCVRILHAIRAAISPEDVAAGRVSLAVLETGAFESLTPGLLQHRLEIDLTMLMAFGDAKERDEEQSRKLLHDGGFTPGRLLPTTGLMTIQEAVPAAAAAGAAAAGAARPGASGGKKRA